MNSPRRSLKSLLVPLLLIVAISVGLLYRQNIYDWWRLRGYNPPARIETIAKQTTLTAEGKHTFYVAHPQLNGKTEFNQNCSIPEFSIILGCYVTPGNIFIYDIQDARLKGIIQVTAAHEMLHAAYDRLSADERERVNTLLDRAYKNITDDRIKSTIAQYKNHDSSSVHNELHSIIGTEVRQLPDELEAYYRKYFSDRSKVVAYSEQYEKEFSSRQELVAQYDRQLASLKSEIERLQASLGPEARRLSQEQQELNSSRGSDDKDDFNDQARAYNEDVDAYNAKVAEARDLINEYNALVAKRNALALEVEGLVKAIDSTPSSL